MTIKMSIECEWYENKEAPLVKLHYKGFICNKCYKELERRQKEFDKLLTY